MLPPVLETEYALLVVAMVKVKVVEPEPRTTEDRSSSKGEPIPSECLTAESAGFYSRAERGGGSSSAPSTCTLTFAVRPPLHLHASGSE